MLRKYLAYFLISVLSLSSVGTPVFTHMCSGMGKSWSSLFVQPSACCAGLRSHSGKEKCKSFAMRNGGCQMKKMPCCENKVSFVALSSIYTFQHHSSLLPGLVFSLPWAQINSFDSGYYSFWTKPLNPFSKGPPLRHGRSLLIFEQLFLC